MNMVYHTLLTFSLTVVLVSGRRYSKSIEAQPRIGYSTSVVHNSYPGFNDLQAESSHHHQYTQTSINEPKNSNLFNVGYNLSFNENSFSPRKKEQRYTRVNNNKKFENAEVITGKLKKNEKVRAPSISSSSDLSPQDFVANAFLKQKQLNSRYTTSPINTKGSKYASQSPTFTYNTQQNIFKDIIKSTRPDPIQLSPDFETSYETRGRWKNIETGRGLKHINVLTQMQPNFNHETALKNSESFDFSHAHGQIRFGEGDSFSEGSEQHSHIVKGSTNAQQQQQQASDLNNLNIEAHIPKGLRGVKPLPLDTSLLKEPVLSTTFREPSKDDRVVPIHFDVRPIQTVMETELSKIKNYVAHHQNPYQQHYRYPAQLDNTNYAPNTNEDHDSASSQMNYRVYGKPEPNDKGQYNVGFSYGKDYANYAAEDVYKIVSMRPPPISHQLRY